MKKTYNRPDMKVVRLLAAESLMNASGDPSKESLNIDGNITATGTNALSNKESEHDIWGNEGSIW